MSATTSLRVTPRYQRDLDMVQHPEKWPKWPLLPLTRRNSTIHDNDHCAFMYDDGKPIVYIGLIFIFASMVNAKTSIDDALAAFETRVFDTFDELADEYTVD